MRGFSSRFSLEADDKALKTPKKIAESTLIGI